MSNLKDEIEVIVGELKTNTEVIKMVLERAALCIEDAQISMDNVVDSLSNDDISSTIAFLTDAQAFIDSIGYKTVKFDTVVDTLNSVKYQLTSNS